MQQKKRYIKKKIHRNVYFGFYLYAILVLMCLLVVSSYTWFTMSRVPQVHNMDVGIVSAQGLELARRLDGEKTEWSQELNFVEMIPNVLPQNLTNRKQIFLRPVTWSDKNGCFYAATYGADGRHKGFDRQLNDNDGYIKITYYARSGQIVNVNLKELVSLNLSTDMSFSALSKLNLAGTFMMAIPGFSVQEILESRPRFADKAVRIGFRTTLLDQSGKTLSQRGPMIIYEPNCNIHVNKPEGYIPTPSIDGTPTLVGSEYDAEGNPNERLILQSATTFSVEDVSSLDEVQINIGTFQSNPTLFRISPGEIAKIEMYIWLEGQDVDCTNEAVFAEDNEDEYTDDQWLLGNIQFGGTTENMTGMTPIPDDYIIE